MHTPPLTHRIAELSLSAIRDKRPDVAETFCQLGLAIAPEAAVFRHHLGLLAREREGTEAALPLLRESVTRFGNERSPEAHLARRDLIDAELASGNVASALELAFATERLWPDDPEIAWEVARTAARAGDDETAADRYARALAAIPAGHSSRASVAFSLGTALFRRRHLTAALAAYREVIEADPTNKRAWCNLGNILSDICRPNEAIKAYEAALTIDPNYINAHSNLLQTLHYLPGQTAASLRTAHVAWAARHYPEVPPRPPVPATRERLVVGLVSEDLRTHPIGYFCAAWMPHARQAGLDIAVYSSNPRDDDLTQQIRRAASSWRDVGDLDDDALAARIRKDAPDVLIDLGGHTGRNRLGVFARCPAPLQATWMGYVGTTGLPQIAGLIADRIHVPWSEDAAYVEDIWRMPEGYVCYAPPTHAPEPRSRAYERNGYISFAAFHNPAKINPILIASWAKILLGIPDSRLRLVFRGFDEPPAQDFIVRTFQAHGISAERLDIRGAVPHADLLTLYNDCDFALDSFPYAGGLTTLEALWMGIPVVAAPGATFASRHSASHITFAGFGGELAANPTDYVRTAIAWANSPPMRDADRTARRARMASSPLCDGRRFAKNFANLLTAARAGGSE